VLPRQQHGFDEECFIMTPEQEAEAIRLYYEDGLTYLKIARRLGFISNTPIYKLFKRRGLKARKRYYKYTLNANIFDDLNQEQASYWLGFIYAEGCTSAPNVFSLQSDIKDKEHLQKLLDFLETNRPLLIYERKGSSFNYYVERHVCTITICNNYLYARLRECGVVKARTKLHRLKHNLPNEQFRHWLRGYFDGDGCARKTQTLEFSGQHDLLRWIRLKMSKQIGTQINQTLNPYKNTSKIVALNYGGVYQSKRIADWLYKDATIWLKRKREIINNW
jgi:hypothetical protein